MSTPTQKGKRQTFHDLVIERILCLTQDETKETLESMFPGKEVRVFTDRGGSTVVQVGEVEARLVSGVGELV